jgi:carbon monoxide dehydrogenase subunit G
MHRPRAASPPTGPKENVMPHAERTIVIDRPPDQVFAFFADPANDRAWRPHVREVAAKGPAAVGSTIHQVVEGPGGRGIAADIEITAFDPPTHYGFRVIAGPARPIGEFRFAPSGAGTAVTFSLRAELGMLKGLILSRPVQSSMDGEMAALDQAKVLLEAS